VAAVYALIVAMFVYRELTVAGLYRVFVDAGRTTGVVMFLCGAATAASYMITLADLPNELAGVMGPLLQNPMLFMAVVAVFLLAVGMVMDLTPTILILGPVLAPLAAKAGIDPVYFGFVFIFVGVLRIFGGDFGGLWIAFVGWFLDNAATAQVHQVVFQGLLAGHTVSQAMSQRCVVIPPDAMLQQVVDEHILSGGQRCLLVNRGENTVGLITLHRIKEVPRNEWPTTRAAQVMLPLEKMKRISPDKELWTALEQMDRDGVNQLPVMTDSRMVGMLSREDVITFLRTLKELSSP